MCSRGGGGGDGGRGTLGVVVAGTLDGWFMFTSQASMLITRCTTVGDRSKVVVSDVIRRE